MEPSSNDPPDALLIAAKQEKNGLRSYDDEFNLTIVQFNFLTTYEYVVYQSSLCNKISIESSASRPLVRRDAHCCQPVTDLARFPLKNSVIDVDAKALSKSFLPSFLSSSPGIT